MALNNLTTDSSRHFWVRVTGLLGVLIAAAGAALWYRAGLRAGIGPVLVGGALALIVLTVELLAAARAAGEGSRRGAVGGNAAGQIALAALLLVGVNFFSFFHYLRFDWTREKQFTLPADLRAQLAQLRDETRIVVYLPHTPINPQATHTDNYDAAAEAQIVEKVRDLAEQFQELGPRFRVDVLDVKAKGYSDKLEALEKEAPELADAVNSTKENTIFIYGGGKVQRLGLQDVYQLDKEESRKGSGNLVLRYQGPGPFARKVLNVEEKRPRVALAVVHPVLGFETTEEVRPDINMKGARKVLAARGFDVRDVILTKGLEAGAPEPVVQTRDENKYEELEEKLAELETSVKELEKVQQEMSADLKKFKDSTLEDLNKTYCLVGEDQELVTKAEVEAAEKKLKRKIPTEPLKEDHRRVLVRQMEVRLVPLELSVNQERKERDATAQEMKGLNVEDLIEKRRISDLKAKFSRALADADLLIIQRLTLLNVVRGEAIPNRVYKLDPTQIDAIKDFIKAGKPVLFCLSPSIDPPQRFDPEAFAGDALESMVSQLGFRLSKQTVLYNAEVKSFGQRRSGVVILDTGEKVEIPGVLFDWDPGAGQPGGLGKAGGEKKLHDIATSLRVTARSLGDDAALRLKLRYPRPVYFMGTGGRKSADGRERFDESAVFMMSPAESWNESQPFPTRDRTPRYEEPKPGDAANGTVDAKRRGPFPLGVAADVPVPESWFGEKEKAGAKDRVAVIGHGGAFTGEELTPTQKQLLLDVSNWLLGRDDLLAKEGTEWRFPRVELSPWTETLLFLVLVVGLPVLSIFLGSVVFLVRRMR
jgi:hypothetical protein